MRTAFGWRTNSVLGTIADRLRERQAEYGLNDSALLAAGGACDQKNLSLYLTGKVLPDARCFNALLDAFGKAGHPLPHAEHLLLEALHALEALERGRPKSEQIEGVTETRACGKRRANRVQSERRGAVHRAIGA